jgi:hypothetical protein
MAVFDKITTELLTDILPKYELSEEALAYIKRVSTQTYAISHPMPQCDARR